MGGLKDGLKKLQDSAKELLDKTDIDDKIVGAAKDFLDKTDIDEKLAGAAKDLKEKAKAALEKTDMDDRMMDAAKGLKEKGQEAYESRRAGRDHPRRRRRDRSYPRLLQQEGRGIGIRKQALGIRGGDSCAGFYGKAACGHSHRQKAVVLP